LSIEPSAIPAALAAFRAAHERVLRKVAELDGITVRPWAGDEVSAETAKQFADRSYGAGAESAMECLRGYEQQLSRACEALQHANDAYTAMEGDNAALWGRRS